MTSQVQEHIAALRQEIEREYTDRLAKLDELEASFLGAKSTASGLSPSTNGATPMGGNIAKVREVLAFDKPQTAKEIAKLAGLDEFAVRNTLKTKAILAIVEKIKDAGEAARFQLRRGPAKQPPKAVGTKGVGGMIREYLSSHPEGAGSGAICAYIVPKMKTKSKNPKNRVQSSLSKMKKAGSVIHNIDNGIYKLPKSK